MALATGAQWLAWRLRIPSILVLLVVGFVAGPVAGLVDPDALLGPLLFPFISLGAAVVLFEGGLTVSWQQLRSVAGPVGRLSFEREPGLTKRRRPTAPGSVERHLARAGPTRSCQPS